MEKLLQQIINGVHVGSIYALIALGYTMVYGIIKLINFAHGDILMIGAFISYFLIKTGLPFGLVVLIAVVASGIIGVSIERIAYKPLRNAPRISALITAIAVSLFIQNLFQVLFKPDPRPFPKVVNLGKITIGNINIDGITIVTILISLLLMVLLELFVNKTRIGKSMKATSMDKDASVLMGININRTISITFAIGSMLGAIGGIFYSIAYPQIDPYMGAMPGLKAFVAAVLGGIGIIPGAMVGGFILGIAESLTKSYISSQMSDAVVFGILILVLLVKPAGLFGKNKKEKV